MDVLHLLRAADTIPVFLLRNARATACDTLAQAVAALYGRAQAGSTERFQPEEQGEENEGGGSGR